MDHNRREILLGLLSWIFFGISTLCAEPKSDPIQFVNDDLALYGYLAEFVVDHAAKSVKQVNVLRQDPDIIPPNDDIVKMMLLRKRTDSSGNKLDHALVCVPLPIDPKSPPSFSAKVYWVKNGVIQGRKGRWYSSDEVIRALCRELDAVHRGLGKP